MRLHCSPSGGAPLREAPMALDWSVSHPVGCLVFPFLLSLDLPANFRDFLSFPMGSYGIFFSWLLLMKRPDLGAASQVPGCRRRLKVRPCRWNARAARRQGRLLLAQFEIGSPDCAHSLIASEVRSVTCIICVRDLLRIWGQGRFGWSIWCKNFGALDLAAETVAVIRGFGFSPDRRALSYLQAQPWI